jgi:hypothetical protein
MLIKFDNRPPVADLLLQHMWNKLVFAKSRAVGWHKVSAVPTVLRGESDTTSHWRSAQNALTDERYCSDARRPNALTWKGP